MHSYQATILSQDIRYPKAQSERKYNTQLPQQCGFCNELEVLANFWVPFQKYYTDNLTMSATLWMFTGKIVSQVHSQVVYCTG